MEPKSKVLLTIGTGVLLVLFFYFISYSITKYTGFAVIDNKDTFRSCLKEKDITLFINSENSEETLKNIQSIDYLNEVKIINCVRNNQVCVDNGISSFPSWMIENNKIDGDISISDLARVSGCKI